MSYNNYKDDYRYNGNYPGYRDNTEVVSVGAWIGIFILMAIPIVNIIGLLIMAFGHGNANLKTFAKASLILMVILLALTILFKGCA